MVGKKKRALTEDLILHQALVTPPTGTRLLFHTVNVIAFRATGKRIVLAPENAQKFTLQAFA